MKQIVLKEREKRERTGAKVLEALEQDADVQPSARFKTDIERSYWESLSSVLGRGNRLTLPASWEVDSVNWMEVFFDYLATSRDPTKFGEEWAIPDTIIVKCARIELKSSKATQKSAPLQLVPLKQ